MMHLKVIINIRRFLPWSHEPMFKPKAIGINGKKTRESSKEVIDLKYLLNLCIDVNNVTVSLDDVNEGGDSPLVEHIPDPSFDQNWFPRSSFWSAGF